MKKIKAQIYNTFLNILFLNKEKNEFNRINYRRER